MGYGWAAFLFFGGIAVWILVHSTARKNNAPKLSQGATQATIADPLVLLQRENPDLPMVPPGTDVYEVWEIWFREAMRRIALRSTRRTREETLKLNDQLLRYQLQCLTYLKNKAGIREAGELADLEFQAKKQEILLRIAQSKAEIEALSNPNRLPRPHIDV
jgi:hypothetical protein